MKCKACGAKGAKVVDSRLNEEGTTRWRRRKCSCGKHFATYEIYEGDENPNKAQKQTYAGRLKQLETKIKRSESILHGLKVELGKAKKEIDTLFGYGETK